MGSFIGLLVKVRVLSVGNGFLIPFLCFHPGYSGKGSAVHREGSQIENGENFVGSRSSPRF